MLKKKINFQEQLTSNLTRKTEAKESNEKNGKSKMKSPKKKSIPQGGRGEL